jgi:hypothetical protein
LQVSAIYKPRTLQLRDQLQDTELIEHLRNEHFDLGLTEYNDICSLGLFEKIGIYKHAAFTPLSVTQYMSEAFGLPSMSSFVPGFL